MPRNTGIDPLTGLEALRWRCIGPPRGGRVVAVAGDPDNRMTFYFGACAGGIWKTEDGGTYWQCVSDGFLSSATIGALTVAPSDPNVIYAGTGETTIRVDVSYGDGIYRSTDAGRSWTHMGLADSRHIGRILVHPDDPDLVYVAVLGDAFGPSSERGVYRSTNGGESWERVLDRGPDAGAIDLSFGLGLANPLVLYASFWQARRSFWKLSSGGPGSGLFVSGDGGDSWEDISERPGMPAGPLGKIGVASSFARQGRVFALVEAQGEQTGLYRSEDAGQSWSLICRNRELMHRPWYYAHIHADPLAPDTVYVNNMQLWKSTDGGNRFQEISTPHLDNHDLWIDPADPTRMVQGNDGGACVSFNGGTTWSSVYNQCTAQFYRMDVDNQYPYRVYGTQQDNTSISVPSATEWGRITMADCVPVGTGESGFIAVHPENHDLVFVGAVGSSPGGNGALQRYDHRTRQIQLVNVWPEEAMGVAPSELRYRFAWTFPITFSPHDSGVLYAGGSHVFRSRDEGMHWERISPDLSRRDESKLGLSGGPVTGESAGAEQYGTCASLVESPHSPGEIWVSTDDGRVQKRPREGADWQDVTPPDMPEFSYIGCVEISPQDADTVYLAATRYKLSDYRPYLWRSGDGGASWERISDSLPQDEITRVLRADPKHPGLLFVGTETGVFWSRDDGVGWERMKGGLPVVPVYDLRIKDSDLVAATHGRSFWIADDIAPLRDLPSQIRRRPHLLTPRPAIRTRLNWSAGLFSREGKDYGPVFGLPGTACITTLLDGTKQYQYLDCGENPPAGAILNYRLAEEASEVSITIQNAKGRRVAEFRSADSLPGGPTGRAGLNRFVWNLTHDAPVRLDPGLANLRYLPFAPEEGGDPSGPLAVPGDYTVAVRADGRRSMNAQLTIRPDPRLSTTDEDYAALHALHARILDGLSKLNDAVNRLRTLRRELGTDAGKLRGQLDRIEGELVNLEKETPDDMLRHRAGLDDTLKELAWLVRIADARPPQQAGEVADEELARLNKLLAEFKTLTRAKPGKPPRKRKGVTKERT